MRTFSLAFIFYAVVPVYAQSAPATSVQQILQSYAEALGGNAAIDRIRTRQCEAKEGHTKKFKLYWQAPDLVLWVEAHEKEGFDGSTAWSESKRKKITKLPAGRKEDLETDANPIRFVHLPDLYHDLAVDKPATLEGTPMDVIASPNAIGATRFFFGHGDHLLYRIEDFGRTSAYYKHTTEFADYETFDGVRIPTRITRHSDEPGARNGEIRLSKIVQNTNIQPSMFKKPDVGKVITAAKH